LHEVAEGRMRGKPTTGKFKRYIIWQKDYGYVALKRAAEDTGQRQRKGVKPAL